MIGEEGIFFLGGGIEKVSLKSTKKKREERERERERERRRERERVGKF